MPGQVLAYAFVALVAFMPLATTAADDTPVFEKDVLPIFTRYCFNCHGKSSPQLGLDLRSARLTMRGSQNGPVVVKGSLEKSLLWKKVSTREMPLELFKLKLSDAEIDVIRRWIAGGAPSDQPADLPSDVQKQLTRYEQEIQPIFNARCVSCHGEDEQEAELDLTSLETLVRGSKSGPVVYEGFSEKSTLIRKVTSHLMPPPDADEPLSTAEIAAITGWIDKGRFIDFVDAAPRRAGATDESDTITEDDRQFWAFRQPIAVPLPDVSDVDRVRTPVDRFMLAKLESQGLGFSPDAPKIKLLRRAYFDLLGLPPTPEQAREFILDERPDAYERLIDRLLASPHYGERWGRHWLDSVGYVDTTGKDHSPTNPALSDGYWRYRDYVINATNKDTPWDAFLTEQIAGDELVDWRNADAYTPRTLELLTATGYLRNVLDATDEDISNLPFDRYEALFMLMDRVSTSTLGMTLACARCHSHKFDPIPQTDYYRFLSVFTAAYNPSDWLPPKQRHLYDVSNVEKQEIDQQRARVTQLKEQLASINKRYQDKLLADKLQQVPEEQREATKAAVEAAAKKRTAAQKKLVEEFGERLAVTDAEVTAALDESDRTTRDDLREQLKTSQQFVAAHPMSKVQALWDVGKAPTIRLLHRGDVDFAGPVVQPGFLSVLSPPGKSAAIPSLDAVGETTGLRLAFAQWLTSQQHPLTARVIVNRIWQHHFGKGIVDTPGNFGATGSRPTHPELLDWLAVEFMRQGWSAKHLHKLLMTSTVYRQAAHGPDTNQRGEQVDPENKLLWRMNLRRLDAESLRDAVVVASGEANLTMGGPPVKVKAMPSGLQTVDPGNAATRSRRSVYLLARRSNPVTFLRLFDYPVIDVNCTRRSTSATPLQSLTMINSQFLVESAKQLARQLEGEETVEHRIEAAYWRTLSRAASPAETEAAAAYLVELQQLYANASTEPEEAPQRSFENFVHMLMCSNEFLYVD